MPSIISPVPTLETKPSRPFNRKQETRLLIGFLKEAMLRNLGHLWLTLLELAKANQLFLFFIPQA